MAGKTLNPDNPEGTVDTEKERNKVGRPSSYRPEYCEIAIQMGGEGKLPAQIAARFMVAKSTIQGWAAEFPEFMVAIKLAKTLCESWELDTLQDNANATVLAIAKWRLSAYHQISEVNKQEIKQEVKDTTVNVSFGDRDDNNEKED